MWTATHSASTSVSSLEQNEQRRSLTTMAAEPIFSHRCAVPAPLRISPKPASDPGHGHNNPQASPDPRATPCTLRSRLPGQPVFVDPAEGSSNPDSLRATNKCSCPKSPASPAFLPSPLSPRQSFLGASRRSSSTTTTNASRGPSLDFSSLFMRSETLRHELETCACHHQQGDAAAARPAASPLPAASDRGYGYRRDSSSSGYTSCYSN